MPGDSGGRVEQIHGRRATRSDRVLLDQSARRVSRRDSPFTWSARIAIVTFDLDGGNRIPKGGRAAGAFGRRLARGRRRNSAGAFGARRHANQQRRIRMDAYDDVERDGTEYRAAAARWKQRFSTEATRWPKTSNGQTDWAARWRS